MDFRRKANRWVTKTQGKPSQPERSGGLFLNMAPRKVAGRGGAAKSRSASGTYVGPACRNGLSPQGEPMGTRNPRKTEPTRTIRQADFGSGTLQGRRSRRGREVPLGKRDLLRTAVIPFLKVHNQPGLDGVLLNVFDDAFVLFITARPVIKPFILPESIVR